MKHSTPELYKKGNEGRGAYICQIKACDNGFNATRKGFFNK